MQSQRIVSRALSVGMVVLPRGAERRRSERRVLDVPIVVSGHSQSDGGFREQTFTIAVNAHGALVVLSARVALGQKLTLKNPGTQKEVEARVVCFGPPSEG